jgi:hypothetical protein
MTDPTASAGAPALAATTVPASAPAPAHHASQAGIDLIVLEGLQKRIDARGDARGYPRRVLCFTW